MHDREDLLLEAPRRADDLKCKLHCPVADLQVRFPRRLGISGPRTYSKGSYCGHDSCSVWISTNQGCKVVLLHV